MALLTQADAEQELTAVARPAPFPAVAWQLAPVAWAVAAAVALASVASLPLQLSAMPWTAAAM